MEEPEANKQLPAIKGFQQIQFIVLDAFSISCILFHWILSSLASFLNTGA